MQDALRLLFVCTGNICRSPWRRCTHRPQGRARRIIEARSGGVLGIIDKPADPLAVKVMGEINIDLEGHRSSGVTDEMMDWARYVLVMELHHAIKLRERFPAHEDKVLVLANFGGMREVKDPIGGWRWKFRRCRADVIRCVDNFLNTLPN